MAKKKTPVETPEEPTEDINYQDIKDSSIEEIATETPEEPKEEVVEEKPVEDTPEEPKEEFNAEEFKKETTDAVTQAAKDAVTEALQAQSQDKNIEKADELQVWADAFAKDKGRPPTWVELANHIKDTNKEEVLADIKAEQAREAEAQVKAEEDAQLQQQKDQEAVNKYVDAQFAELYQKDFPKIVNKDDPSDFGIKSRQELARQTMEINRKRLAQGLPTKTLVEVYFTEYIPPTDVAGANAPINKGGAPGNTNTTDEIDYREVRGRSFFDIALGRK